MSNKNAKDSDINIVEKDFYKLVAVVVLILLVVFSISIPITQRDKPKEDVEVFDVEHAWLKTNESFHKSGDDCEIFKVDGFTKSYDPKRVKLRLLGFGEVLYRSVEIPRTTNITFIEKEPSVKKFIKACYSADGYIATVEEYPLEKKFKEKSKEEKQ